ncbi:hypothetical protein HMPREF9422_1357 [Streptococcus cristatus ATCC 51100]|jgi:hypothetical protein|uniref:Lipoprotein n=1 Tax=Streptococcus cristatus ATCC 51100 TaxID=889201 RepID=A0AAV3EHF8_STRCR|nr:DUF6287 domain-containing protein [Streptococcus cristatus]EFX52516.1 hypothetical protein HMPREF9422_1357 [Streptococcus cristatus ATCC 51100]EGU69018.1 putative lipoprotein [Streptococcus cristatus ATCC 51100]KJQ61671.1 lipoprotein [Streptococcus cristatus]MCG7331017.1 DUF6287 domain-containing protein [Streptococcus cristatus]SQG31473.1 lipoprotein [Streptococcus cristatus ATCC 51100]
MKRSKLILLTATALYSAFLLAACSSKPSTKVNSSSTSQTSKTSSLGESSTKSSAKQSSASNEAKASSTTKLSSDQSVSSQAEKPVENKTSADSNTPTTSGIDVNALANGDFSSIAGTWQDDLGNQLVFDANGLVTLQRNNGETLNHNAIYNGHVEGDKFRADFGYNGAGSSDPLFAVPVGVALPLNGAPAPKEQIMLGSDAISSAQHPYYRVAN